MRRYEYDDHYFLTDPREFIYEFFPLQEDWQLLKQPITLKDFEELPFVRSLFFRYYYCTYTFYKYVSCFSNNWKSINEHQQKAHTHKAQYINLWIIFVLSQIWTVLPRHEYQRRDVYGLDRCFNSKNCNARSHAIDINISLQSEILRQWRWQLWRSVAQEICHASEWIDSVTQL